MPSKRKESKKNIKSQTDDSTLGDIDEDVIVPHTVSLSFVFKGVNPGPGDWIFLVIFNGHVLMETKWQDKQTYHIEELPLNLKEEYHQYLIADRPVMFILRVAGGKGAKDLDPLLNAENRAGGSLDLFPLLMGENEIFVKMHLLSIPTGADTLCRLMVRAKSTGDLITSLNTIPLTLTLLSAHCLPLAREGTVYVGAIGLNDVHDPAAINFGMSLSTPPATKVLWASASNAGQAANTPYNVPKDDKFIPENLVPKNKENCNSFYWNAMRRVLINPSNFRCRLAFPFVVEVAGVPRTGKIDVRGRYMAFVDAGVLLQPDQYGVTVCAKLLFYNELDLPENVGALLELPPSSTKVSARETELIVDEFGHSAFIVLRFDLFDPLTLKPKLAALYESIGYPPPGDILGAVDQLHMDPPEDDPLVDVRRIRKECGALLVHKELSVYSTSGTVQMTQSIKRTAANRMLQRIRTMLKQFSPDEISTINWQDTVTAQHAACRRAVISSFAPQPPLLRASSRIAVSRSRMAGDSRIAEELIQNNLKATPGHPRMLLCKVLRGLEEENEAEALNYVLKALSSQPRNRFLLWILGGITYDKDGDNCKATAAFHITVKGTNMDGFTGAIGWAALHAAYHFYHQNYAAFVAAKRMRKSFELSKDWKYFLQKWVETSGEEEMFWVPSAIDSGNPLLVAAAFFLCLRCYKFSEKILGCVESDCTVRGSKFIQTKNISSDVYYLKTASLLLRKRFSDAFNLIEQTIKRFGPSAKMSQLRVTCLVCLRGWDSDCETALTEADRAGAEMNPALLLKASLGCMKTDPETALQYAARAHKAAPSAHSALAIGRIYAKMDNEEDAERWAAAAVKIEPLLSDGWAFLGLLALSEKNIHKARCMLRTAKQVGPLSLEISKELDKMVKIAKLSAVPDDLVKDLCFCDYY